MSWLQDGLNRLLHPGSSNREAAQQKPASAVTSPTQDRPKSLFGLLQKHSSPPLEQQGVQHTGQGAAGTSQHSSKQHQLLDGPGSAYANLPCLKQLKPIRSAAGDLSAAVLTALPGVKLDSSWVVYQTAVKEPAGLQVNSQAGLSYVCILPALQPPVSNLLDHTQLKQTNCAGPQVNYDHVYMLAVGSCSCLVFLLCP